jgi:Integron Cassette Protein Hfx_Cass5
MNVIAITKVRIDTAGRLHVVPASNPSKMFQFVYRAAMEVNWDEAEQGFYTPVRRELSYADWYLNVLSAVQSEMGISLKLGPATAWENVPPAVEQGIKQRAAAQGTNTESRGFQ